MKKKNVIRDHKTLKSSLMAAISMLLVSSIMMVSTSYAWLVMSVSPEVTGIATNIGANGSLEIALLNTETRQDLSTIKSGVVGQSIVNNKRVANNTWGNLIDLYDDSYGLEDIVLLPARLNITKQQGDEDTDEGLFTVDSALLSVPIYGHDGRIVELTEDTISGVYKKGMFSVALGAQDYGVRAVGTSDYLSPQSSALALAKSNIVTYTNSAKNGAATALSSNGSGLFSLLLTHSSDANATYNDDDLKVVTNMVNGLQSSLDYIENAIRQGILAYAASKISDTAQFSLVRETINSGVSLDLLINGKEGENGEPDEEPLVKGVPEELKVWISDLAVTQNSLNQATNSVAGLEGGSYTWDQLKGALDPLLDMNKVYIGEKLFNNMSRDELMGLIGKDVKMTLVSGSGVFADIADFTGDYSASFSAVGMNITFETMRVPEEGAELGEPYLIILSAAVSTLDAADGGANGGEGMELTTTYGYALDLAFRTNAAASDLLLQTEARQRVYEDSSSITTMGGGSYMEFSSKAEGFSTNQIITLMDAVRVAFLDDSGSVLGIAKLNTSNRVTTDSVVSAPLYLYDFHLSTDEEDYGALIMGERMKTENTLTSLEQNIAKALTVVVWLDGDIVDNTMVAASEDGISMNGIMNLQFASSADLVPAGNSSLVNLTADKSALAGAIQSSAEEFYNNGNAGIYTTVSWNDYVAAYQYAVAVNENKDATDTQVIYARTELGKAQAALQEISVDALKAGIDEKRAFTGKTDEAVYYVIKDNTNNYSFTTNYTQEQFDNHKGIIYRVDYDKNLHDEGNDLKVPIYTDASWTNLANALYQAEGIYLIDQAGNPVTDVEIDTALTALNAAYEALERKVMYDAYEFENQIYYKIITDPENADTYGKWYDAQFKRVISDLLILKLDTKAVKVTAMAEIDQKQFIEYDSNIVMTPQVKLLDNLHATLKSDAIKAINWSVSDHFELGAYDSQLVTLNSLFVRGHLLEGTNYAISKSLMDEAEYVLNAYNDPTEAGVLPEHFTTNAQTEALIEELTAAITSAEWNRDHPNGVPATVELMTANQRTVLTIAANNAKTISGYEDPNNTELDVVRKAVEDIENLLATTEDVLKTDADSSISKINTLLVANNKSEVTEYNTIVHTIPESSDTYDLVYNVLNPVTYLRATGITGTGVIKAVILTENGVVFTVEKEVQIYAPAEKAYVETNAAPEGGTIASTAIYTSEWINPEDSSVKVDEVKANIWDGVIIEGNTAEVTADLLACRDKNATGDLMNFAIHESIKSYTWSSSNMSIVYVIDRASASCTLSALKTGDAYVSVTIETIQGNQYTHRFLVRVLPTPSVEP